MWNIFLNARACFVFLSFRGGSHVTGVTTDHLNQVFRLILRLIMKHIGEETAEWMIGIAMYAQQVWVAKHKSCKYLWWKTVLVSNSILFC